MVSKLIYIDVYVSKIIMLQHAVPSGVVQDLQVTELFPSRAVFSWQPPKLEYQNGVITEYQFSISVDFSNDTIQIVFPNTTGEVNNLQPYTTYRVRIAASTVVGTGPLGETLIFRTLEDGKSNSYYAWCLGFAFSCSSKHRTA